MGRYGLKTTTASSFEGYHISYISTDIFSFIISLNIVKTKEKFKDKHKFNYLINNCHHFKKEILKTQKTFVKKV